MNLDKYVEKVLFSKEAILNRVEEMGKEITEYYKDSKDLIVVGLLKGSVPFMKDLMFKIDLPLLTDFMTVSSYHGGVKSSGSVKIIMDLAHGITGKDVLIVEDIVDTGRTLEKVIDILQTRKPNSIKVASLLEKPDHRVNNFKPDFYGFICPDEFVIGYGLDYKGKLRNLPYVASFNKEYLEKL